jgi:ribonucleoside-diphosphate reductase alpha chain
VPSQQARTESRPGNGAANGGAKAAMIGAAIAESRSRLAAARPGGGANADAQAGSLGGDSPPCNVCGFITIRNGTCFKCTNCGNSMGCS